MCSALYDVIYVGGELCSLSRSRYTSFVFFLFDIWIRQVPSNIELMDGPDEGFEMLPLKVWLERIPCSLRF